MGPLVVELEKVQLEKLFCHLAMALKVIARKGFSLESRPESSPECGEVTVPCSVASRPATGRGRTFYGSTERKNGPL
jgi:hypothetical protein